MRYCKQHDITADLLESFCGEEFDDIADQEFFEIVNGHVIVERFAMEDQAFLFGHDELKEIFAVYDSDKNYSTYTNEKIIIPIWKHLKIFKIVSKNAGMIK